MFTRAVTKLFSCLWLQFINHIKAYQLWTGSLSLLLPVNYATLNRKTSWTFFGITDQLNKIIIMSPTFTKGEIKGGMLGTLGFFQKCLAVLIKHLLCKTSHWGDTLKKYLFYNRTVLLYGFWISLIAFTFICLIREFDSSDYWVIILNKTLSVQSWYFKLYTHLLIFTDQNLLTHGNQ